MLGKPVRFRTSNDFPGVYRHKIFFAITMQQELISMDDRC